MAQELINIGTLPNDGTGDPMRTAFQKINNNFSELYSTYTSVSGSTTTGNTPNQVIYEEPVETFTMRNFFICTTDSNVQNSQTINLTALVNQNRTAIDFNGYGSLFFGNPLSTYDMDINSGNIRITATPFIDTSMFHFVAAQLIYNQA